MTLNDRPSLLSFICPRMLSVGTIDGFRLSMVNRNLLSEFEACDGEFLPTNEFMKVYLRLRPLKSLPGVNENQSVIRCVNDFTVTTSPPDAKKYSSRDKKTNHTFTFSRVLDANAEQSVVFSSVAISQVKGFLEGLNSLLFAYGTTGSGKTYTMQGCIGDLGLIPRAFSMIFQSVKHATELSLMPKDFSDVTTLKSFEMEKILKDKGSILKLSASFSEEQLKLDDRIETCDTDLEVNKDALNTPFPTVNNSENRKISNMSTDLKFAFWISFAEIYNEFVYDLLDPSECSAVVSAIQANQSRPVAGNNSSKNVFSINSAANSLDFSTGRLRRKALDLRTDKNGNVFIKGLHSYPVYSAEEALRLVLVGRQCQKVAATRLNQASSRSHTILTIKAVRVVDKDNPLFARISSLTFCDLAGSERSDKAATGGQSMRIREASNINTSLLTLGRCIECLRHNQAHPDNPRLVPYRDSKLTRLFQGFFTGRGKACMIVNVSPNPELFDETMHALRFSALATRVIVQPNMVVETSIAPENGGETATVKRKRLLLNEKSGKQLSTSKPITATPPTIVPKQSVSSPRQTDEFADTLRESSIAPSDENYVSMIDELPSERASASSDVMHTPTNTGELILDDYTKDELMFMVRELSEQLFECKGELVKQEDRLRQEMCEAMNRQLVEFERLYEESLCAQDRLYTKPSSRRLHEIPTGDELPVDSRNRKRFRPRGSSESGSDSDTTEDSEATTDTSHCEPSGKPAQKVKHKIPKAFRQSLKASNEELLKLRERVSELEGDLAEQQDVIENAYRERDQLQMEVTRLQFSIAQQQSQYMNEQKVKAKAERSTQTDEPVIAENTDKKPPEETHSPHSSDEPHSCSRVLNAGELKTGATPIGGKFFDLSVSPEQAQRLMPFTTELSDSVEATPTTVLRGRLPRTEAKNQRDSHVNRLRDENQALLNRLAHMRGCVQRIAHEKQQAEVELSRLQNLSMQNNSYDSRLSEGLQSFLEHESRMKHLVTIEDLQQQLHELEERFANKHDQLLQNEASYQLALDENAELKQRVLSQVNDLTHVRRELEQCKADHAKELEALRQQERSAREQVRSQLQEQLDQQATRLAQLDADAAVTLNTSIQTAGQTVSHVYAQTSPSPIRNGVEQFVQVRCESSSVESQTEIKSDYHESSSSRVKHFSNGSGDFKKPIPPDANGRLTCPSGRQGHNLRPRNEPKQRSRGSRTSKVPGAGCDRLPKIPNPLSFDSLFADTSDSDDVAGTSDKENGPHSADGLSKDTSGDESDVSEPIASKPKRSGRSRRARSGSQETDRSKARHRPTRSTTATRRLPPLTESDQLSPGAFFPGELDAALKKMDADFLQEDNRPQLRRATRTQTRRRR